MKGRFDIGMSKDDHPSATAHREAVGAVHTYALQGEQKEDRTEQSRSVEVEKCWMTLDDSPFRQDTGLLPNALLMKSNSQWNDMC